MSKAEQQITTQELVLFLNPEEIMVDEDILKARPILDHDEDVQAIEELAKNMQRDSQIEPIVVRADGDGGYKLIAGRRRRDAAILINAGHRAGEEPYRLAAVIKEGVDEQTAFRMALSENLKRKNLSPIQTAKVITELREREDWKGSKGTKKVAQFMQVSPAFVTTHEALLGLDERTQERVNNRGLSAQAAFELLNVKEERREEVQKAAEELQEAKEGTSKAAGKAKNPSQDAPGSKTKGKLKAKHIRTAARVSGASLGFKPLSRGEIMDFWVQVQSPAYGYSKGSIHLFAKTFVMWAEGKIQDSTLKKNFDAMVSKADRGKPDKPVKSEKASKNPAKKAVNKAKPKK